jgi:hypothetical protein
VAPEARSSRRACIQRCQGMLGLALHGKQAISAVNLGDFGKARA